jgi:hypothetical protein
MNTSAYELQGYCRPLALASDIITQVRYSSRAQLIRRNKGADKNRNLGGGGMRGSVSDDRRSQQNVLNRNCALESILSSSPIMTVKAL